MIATTIFDGQPFIDLPFHLLGWIGWFGLAALLLWGLRKNLSIEKQTGFWWVFGVLLLFTVATALFFQIRLPFLKTIPLPGITRESSIPFIQLFASIPWILAAGILGVWPAVVLAFISGTIDSFWGTHSVFTPLETGFLALLIGISLRQNYRSRLFKFLRSPLGAALGVSLISTPLILLSTFFGTNGNLAARLDYAFTQSWVIMLVNFIQLVFAGLVCELFLVSRSKRWVKVKSFVPSPYETGLQDRVLYISLPLVIALLLTLAVADWIVAGRAAQEMLQSQLEGTAKTAAENIPAVIDTGQGLVLDIVASNIPLDDKSLSREFLKLKLRTVPFFSQLFLFDLTGAPITGYPIEDIAGYQMSPEEQAGITLALNGVLIQSYVVAPSAGETSAQIVYIAAIPDEYGLAKGVITARTNLNISLFSQPAIQALEAIKKDGGDGVVLDAGNRILYHTNPALILTSYQGVVPDASSFFEDTGSDGTRIFAYAAITEKKDWKVVLTLPASYAQELALQTAIPLLAISLIISMAGYFLLRFMVSSLTNSLVNLANKADEISKGGLDQQIEVIGVDEVGRLSSSFEQMRVSLKKRLEELDTLLEVSKGVSSSFGLENISRYLLKACLSYGADSSRLAILGDNLFGINEDIKTFSAGNDADLYKELDKILVDQLREEPIIVIPSKTRIKKLGLEKTTPVPSAVAGISIKDGEKYFGVLWIAYTQTHRFHDEEIRFLNTIASQATLAVSNASLYFNSEIPKKRLESVLASTPEPVLVVSDDLSLLIANKAAREVPGLITLSDETTPLSIQLGFQSLIDFLSLDTRVAKKEKELRLEDGKIYEVSVSPVEIEDSTIGKVCVLRDITEFRELEKLKSDFVATVSHDLRAPMGILRGYASMIQMVGDLSQQQKEYSDKIIHGLENLDQMVEKLLDIGRIESGMSLQLENVAPFELIDNAIRLLQPLAAQRKVAIMRELTIAQDLVIEADKALVQQALYNLIENAVKFSPVNGQINLRLQTSEGNVIFEIEDHGPGIAPLDIQKVFERGYNINKREETIFKGAGLGLSIVKSIAERHKGRAWAASILGKGSTFFLAIPIRQSKIG
jgi:signal transduction histidine kinase/HAMP domain-containing protein